MPVVLEGCRKKKNGSNPKNLGVLTFLFDENIGISTCDINKSDQGVQQPIPRSLIFTSRGYELRRKLMLHPYEKMQLLDLIWDSRFHKRAVEYYNLLWTDISLLGQVSLVINYANNTGWTLNSCSPINLSTVIATVIEINKRKILQFSLTEIAFECCLIRKLLLCDVKEKRLPKCVESSSNCSAYKSRQPLFHSMPG